MAPIDFNGGVITYTTPDKQRLGLDTFSFSDVDWSIHDSNNVLKQIKFVINPTTTTPGTLTLQCDIAGDTTLNLTNLVSGNNAFGIIQPPAGTSPTATTSSDTLNLTSTGGTITITGNSGTKTVNYDIATGSITNSLISASAGIEFSKMAALTASRVAITNTSGVIEASSSITTPELGTLDGINTGVSIQFQLDSITGSLSSYFAKSGDSASYAIISGEPVNGEGYIHFSAPTNPSFSIDSGFMLYSQSNGVLGAYYKNITDTQTNTLLNFTNIINTDRTIYFPDLVSDSNVAYWEDSKFLKITGSPNENQGFLNFTTAGTPGSPPSEGITLYSGDAQALAVYNATSNVRGLFRFDDLTGDREYTLQDNDGTIAHVSDIGAALSNYLSLSGGTMSGTLTSDGSTDFVMLNLKQNSTHTSNSIEFRSNADAVLGGFAGNQVIKMFLNETSLPANVTVHITNPSATDVALTLEAHASQSANIYTVTNSAGTVQSGTSSDFRSFWGTTAASVNRLALFNATATTQTPIAARGQSGQSANLINVENNAASSIWAVTATGRTVAEVGSTSNAAYSFQSGGTVDADTGMYSTGANNVDFVTGGTRRLNIDSNGNIRALTLHNNATAQGSASNQDIRSGTYTPSLTNVTNVAASTAYKCQWLRVGNVVTVTGKVDIDPTATGATELGMSLPVTSNLAAEQDLAGVGASVVGGETPIAIRADATNDRAAFIFTAISTSNDSRFFTFSYEVI